VIYDSHELFFDRWSPESRYPLKHVIQLMRPLEKILARRAVAVITASDESADWMMKTLAIPRPLALLNTVDVRRLGPPAATYDIGNRKKVVHSGGLYHNRHLEELIASMVYWPDDIALILMGSGPLKQSLLRQATELGVNDRMLIVPPVPPDSVAPTLAQADASVVLVASQPLHYDLTMANKFFESVTAGLPIVCSPTTAAARVMRKYNLGIVCDPSNPKLLAEAIVSILQPENQQLYRTNVQQAQNIFTWEAEERKLVALFKRILG
ncbi:MAG: glycosyltransferase, partial [Anaerolineae bacterium]|nr:glycosyltransferase [Anaerolineae bacterium]